MGVGIGPKGSLLVHQRVFSPQMIDQKALFVIFRQLYNNLKKDVKSMCMAFEI